MFLTPSGGAASASSRDTWEGVHGTAAHSGRAATHGWDRQPWHDWVDEEQRATREAVALFDQTSFGKLRVHGPDALALSEHILGHLAAPSRAAA